MKYVDFRNIDDTGVTVWRLRTVQSQIIKLLKLSKHGDNTMLDNLHSTLFWLFILTLIIVYKISITGPRIHCGPM